MCRPSRKSRFDGQPSYQPSELLYKGNGVGRKCGSAPQNLWVSSRYSSAPGANWGLFDDKPFLVRFFLDFLSYQFISDPFQVVSSPAISLFLVRSRPRLDSRIRDPSAIPNKDTEVVRVHVHRSNSRLSTATATLLMASQETEINFNPAHDHVKKLRIVLRSRSPAIYIYIYIYVLLLIHAEVLT